MAPEPSTSIQYSIEPTYTVVIPQTVTAGNSLAITATSINTEPNKQVVVKISSGISAESEQSVVKLIRQMVGGGSEEERLDESNVLFAPVTLGAGFVDNYTRIASFRGVSTDNLIQDTLFIGTPGTEGKLAGTYKGSLTFEISYTDIAV
jgi:hypothetical protein